MKATTHSLLGLKFPDTQTFIVGGHRHSEFVRHFTNATETANILIYNNNESNIVQKQPAQVLTQEDLPSLLHAVSLTRHATRNLVMVYLSYYAGLRACEISGLLWSMLLGPTGRMKGTIELGSGITKGGRYRAIPVSDILKKALKKLHAQEGKPKTGPVIRSERVEAMTPRSVVNWFKEIYSAAGMEGCTSHSGRRSFITQAARKIAKVNGSLRDVQELAGHRSLSTTERYIQGDRAIQRKLVNLL
jgi:integrase